jgi:hypothetical protein
MLNVIRWLLIIIGGVLVLYSILLFAGIFLAPVYLRFDLYRIITLFAGIGILLSTLGFFPTNKKS